MTQIATDRSAGAPAQSVWARLRPWIALVVAVALFTAVALGLAPFTYAAPVIGLVLALGAPADEVEPVRAITRGPRNVVLGAALVVALAAVVWQPQLTLPLVVLFGMNGSGLAVSLLAVVALAIPLAMAVAPVDASATGRFLLARRNLILSLAVLVTVATWHGSQGHSFLPLAVFVIVLPLVIGVSRLVAGRRGRLEYGLLRAPLRRRLVAQRLQLGNVVLFCALAAATVPTGAYAALAVQVPGLYRVLLVLFFLGLAALVALALVPLRRVRMASNLLVVAGTIFLAVQLTLVYRPAVDPVIVASPVVGEWWVGHGGRAELVNYHHSGPMQANAVDLMQVGSGGIHRPGSTELSSYYIFDQTVLAPVDGTVTYVLDGRPDQLIGQPDERHPSGNQLVIDIGGGRHLMMGHLRQGSITVRVGDRVREGQPIARVGNSGHSSAPHLHIQAQSLPVGIGDIEAVDLPQMLRTLHTYPLLFRDAGLLRDGVQSRPAVLDVRRGDHVRPTPSS